MKNDQMFRRKYGDLLGDATQSGHVPVISELDDIAAAISLPSSLSGSAAQLFHAYEAQQQQAQAKRWLLPLPRRSRRLRTAAAVLLIIVMLTGAGSGFYRLLERVFTMHPSTAPIIAEGMGTALNLSQTVDGFTVKIHRVYADANQVAIAYTISGPPGRILQGAHLFGSYQGKPLSSATATMPTLTDVQGRVFEGAPASWGAGGEDGTFASLLRYDTPVGIGNPQELRLRFEAGAIEAMEVLNPAAEVANPESCFENSERDARICAFVVRGAFVFDFTVLLQKSRVAELSQAVEADGRTVVLERVVVAPTGTRVALRGVGPTAVVELQAGEVRTTLQIEGAIGYPWDAGDLWEYRTSAALMDQFGEWILVVKPGQPGITTTPNLSAGPWTFHFEVP